MVAESDLNPYPVHFIYFYHLIPYTKYLGLYNKALNDKMKLYVKRRHFIFARLKQYLPFWRFLCKKTQLKENELYISHQHTLLFKLSLTQKTSSLK